MATMLDNAALLARLISFDSTSSKSNLPIADFICDYLDHPRIRIARNESTDGTKVNLVIRVGESAVEASDHGGLVLSGHLDTVPATEAEWQSDPFQLAETDDTFVGRGTCDMKGFNALAINLAREAADWPLAHPLVLIFTFDEELGTLGAQHLMRTWQHPFELSRGAIIGEPTSLRAVRMHKGYLKMRITFRGRSAHTGYPDLGVNAIEPAGLAITALAEFNRQLRDEHHDTSRHFPEAPYLSLTVATITGGTALNIIPDRCELGIGARLLPGTSSESLVGRIRTMLAGVDGLGDYSFEVIGDSPSMLTAEDTDVYRRLVVLLSQTETHGVSYATDAGTLQSMGMECVLFGPGDIAVAHKPNEFLPKKEFARAGTLLEQLAREFCCS